MVRVETARQMLEAARAALPADVFVAAAAVADWRVEKAGDQKLKKGPRGARRPCPWSKTPTFSPRSRRPGPARPALVVGFAAETENVLENARGKLARKGCDLIVANSVAEGTGVFGGADNEVQIVSPSGTETWPRMSKAEIAKKLIGLIALENRGPEMITVLFQRFPHAEGLPLPHFQSDDAAGMDLVAAVAGEEDMVIKPGERALVPTGLAIELPSGYEAQIRPRSGLALKEGITVLNSPGTIDADYRGEIGVLLINLGQKAFSVRRGARIAQLVVARVERVAFVGAETLTMTVRGPGGFGSTGRSQEGDRE